MAKNVKKHSSNNQKCVVCNETTVSRAYFVQLYCEPMRWERALRECEHYAYIKHDKDIGDNGQPKTAHYHLALYFGNARKWTAVKAMFNLDGLTEDTTINGQIPRTHIKRCGEYLIHLNDSSKHQYSLNEVTADDINWWFSKEAMASENDLNLLEDIINGGKSYYEMAQAYGRDYMLNFRRYQEFAYEVNKQIYEAESARNIAEFLQNCIDGCDVMLEESYALADIIPHLIYAMAKCRIGYRQNAEESIRCTISMLMNSTFKIAQGMGEMI